MKKPFKVPFDERGNQITQIYRWDKPKLVDNYIFEETLFYDRYEGASSTSVIVWRDRTGKEYRSSLVLLDKILSGKDKLDSKKFLAGFSITGKFTFVKRGTAIFLTLAD